MKRHILPFALLSLAFLLAPAVSPGDEKVDSSVVRMADGPLGHIPENAFVVMRFASIDKFLGNFRDMMAGIGPVAAPAGDAAEEMVGEMFELRDRLSAADRKSPVYLAIFPFFEVNEPPIVWFVRTENELNLRRAVLRAGETQKLEEKVHDDGFVEVTRPGSTRKFYFAKRGKYVAYARLERVVEQFRGKPKSIARAFGARGRKALEDGDAGMALHVAPVVAKHKEDIETARREVYQSIKDLPDEQIAVTASAKAIKEFYTSLARFAFDSVYDVSYVAGNIGFAAAGARGEALVGIKPDSKLDALLAANSPAALENLDLLPAAAPMYYGLNFNPDMMAEFIQMSLYFTGSDDDKNKKAVELAVKNLREGKLGAMVTSFALPGAAKTGMMISALTEAADAKKIRAAYAAFPDAMGEMKTPMFTQLMEYKKMAENYKKHAIDEMLIKIKLTDPNKEEAKIIKGMLDKFYGGEALQTRLTTLENMLVQSTGNDPKFIQNLVDSLESGEGVAGLRKPYSKTRDALAEDANLLLMINVPQMIVDAVNTFKDVPPFNAGLGFLPFNFNVKPPESYAGFSVTTERQGLRFKAFMPIEQPKGILQIFMPGG